MKSEICDESSSEVFLPCGLILMVVSVNNFLKLLYEPPAPCIFNITPSCPFHVSLVVETFATRSAISEFAGAI